MKISVGSVTLPEPPGRRERRKAVTRRDLLLAGRKLFSEKGLYDCRVEEITERADIGKGTLYQYFRNKEELVFAVVQMGFADVARRTSERAGNATRFEDIVSAIVESHLAFFRENPDLLKIFHQVRGMLKFNCPEWRPLRRILGEHLEVLAGELRRGAPKQGLGHARARELANLLFGSVSGWLSVRMATDPRSSVEPAPPGLTEALLVMARRFVATNGRAALPSGKRRNKRPAATRASRLNL
jgi:AcrR family transcriptional regulator